MLWDRVPETSAWSRETCDGQLWFAYVAVFNDDQVDVWQGPSRRRCIERHRSDPVWHPLTERPYTFRPADGTDVLKTTRVIDIDDTGYAYSQSELSVIVDCMDSDGCYAGELVAHTRPRPNGLTETWLNVQIRVLATQPNGDVLFDETIEDPSFIDEYIFVPKPTMLELELELDEVSTLRFTLPPELLIPDGTRLDIELTYEIDLTENEPNLLDQLSSAIPLIDGNNDCYDLTT